MAYRRYYGGTSWALYGARRTGLMPSWAYYLFQFLRALFRLAR